MRPVSINIGSLSRPFGKLPDDLPMIVRSEIRISTSKSSLLYKKRGPPKVLYDAPVHGRFFII